ncbi:MAG TPA: class I SAM-dependent methyltransferase [Bryobacteraceae bacterium]|jgi:predicted RNA methylase|nr:class I SAM-dependent methyltransferase [Bryobacteraceae bacterium]
MLIGEAAEARTPSPQSFRDPAGTLFEDGKRILRQVNPEDAAGLEAFLATKTAARAIGRGALVGSLRLSDHLYEHERIPFPSYPCEWPPEMLHAAGELTIELARSALEEGYGIKDATPYNVLFRGSRPVFVDVLSFESRDPRDPTWLAYGQFTRTFLLPLLANRETRIPLASIFAAQRDGLEPEAVYRLLGPLRRLLPPYLNLVSIPKWLSGRETPSTYRPKLAASAGQARFILDRILRGCARQLRSLAPARRASKWSGYIAPERTAAVSYTPSQFAQKEQLVRDALAIARPREVFDAGANQGHFSFLAAGTGASVVAIDSDEACAGAIWREASKRSLNVLPLVVDLTRPTPAMGWRNRECAPFLARARHGFDLVMMLAVLHHILVTERIPLEELFALAEELTRDYLLIEFVGSDDPCFKRIVRGRDRLYSHLTRECFEAAASARFDLVSSTRIDGMERWIYLYRRRRAIS